MKPTSLIAISTAVLGFALGWIVKPAGPAQSSVGSDNQPPPRLRPDNSELIAPSVRRTQGNIGSAEASPQQREKPQTLSPDDVRQHQAYLAAGGVQERARLARFAEALGLDNSQLDEISALLSKHKGATTVGSPDLLAQAADGELEFDEALQALLNDDQKKRLESFKTRTVENYIEASAQEDLVKVMDSIDLSSEQREYALEAFRERLQNSEPREPDSWDLLTGRRGRSLSGGSDGESIRDLFSDPSIANDPQEFARRLAEEQKKVTQEKLDALSNILTPAQLQEYRAALEARYDANSTFFNRSIRDPRFR